MQITKRALISICLFIFIMFVLQIAVRYQSVQQLKEGLEEVTAPQVFNTNLKCDKLCARIKKGQPCDVFESNKMIKCLDRNNMLIEPKCVKSNTKSFSPCVGSV